MMYKHEQAISRIINAYEIAEARGEKLICAYSGGKDSDVLMDLCLRSGVEFKVEHNHTTADAPDTVYHIREVFNRLDQHGIDNKINYPSLSMWELIPKKLIPPTRLVRYCCEYLKERRFKDQHMLLGVRWAESNNRKTRGLHEEIGIKKDKRKIYQDENDNKRKLNEVCISNNKIVTNPIIDWSDRDIWLYIRDNKIKYNPLYDKGYCRVGCIGCPMAGKHVHKEFNDYPKYKNAYISAFDRMLDARKKSGKHTNDYWKNAESVFKWWTNINFDPNQLSLDELL